MTDAPTFSRRAFMRVAMATAGIMVAHQVAAKAFRDAAFLTAWPATALPLMTVATTALPVALVPVFSRLLGRFSALTVMASGFALSAAAHAAEFALYDAGRWITVVIYLHLASVGAVLLSGFWSLIAERFDPAGARASYGRIAAAGTVGGILGSLTAERIATIIAPVEVLVLLTILHVLCATGVTMIGRAPALFPRSGDARDSMSDMGDAFRTRYLGWRRSCAIHCSAAATSCCSCLWIPSCGAGSRRCSTSYATAPARPLEPERFNSSCWRASPPSAAACWPSRSLSPAFPSGS